MKPRIIILMHYMELGGAEMSLLGLLQALDPDKIDVDLFLYSHQGALLKFVPDSVNLLPEMGSYRAIECPMVNALKSGYIGLVCGRLYAKFKHKKFLKTHNVKEPHSSLIQYVGECVVPWLPKINPQVEYDLCISFLAPHHIGLNKVNAKKRLAWIHTDYSTIDIDIENELKVWEAYDVIASISTDVTKAFIKTFPSLESKIIEIENIIPEHYVRSHSEEFDASEIMS